MFKAEILADVVSGVPDRLSPEKQTRSSVITKTDEQDDRFTLDKAVS